MDGKKTKDVPIVERLRKKSPFRQYQDLFVGERSWSRFLLYELVYHWTGSLPGALGYAARSVIFKSMFKTCGRGALFGRNMVVRCPGRISIGENNTFDDGVVLDAKGEVFGEITLGKNIWIGRNTILTSYNGKIRTGDDISIGPFVTISSHSTVDIGSNVSISPYCAIIAASKEIADPRIPMLKQQRTSKGIRIGSNVWLGAGVSVLDGVDIGDDVVVGAGAVVNKSIPLRTVAIGVPARVVRERKAG